MLKDLRAAPNQLTFLRLCIIPFLVIAVLDGRYRTAFGLFILAGISDGLDGLLARILQQRTRLGEYLDPIADKLLLSTLFLVLMHQGLISRRVTILVFSRDVGIVVVGALLFATAGIRDFRPSLWGKANTVAQIIAVASTLWTAFYAPYALLLVRRLSLVATFGLTLISWFHYTWRETRRLASEESRESRNVA
ncbi:MAG TPA: CDP-alcohol phosphatidyltransferase family protein [Acidobacteriaceae bacterium]